MARALIANLAGRSLPDATAQAVRSLDAGLPKGDAGMRRILDGLFGDPTDAAAAPGILRFRGWTATARYLRAVVKAFEGWRDEERWLKNHCPTCGSAPAMVQLVGVDPDDVTDAEMADFSYFTFKENVAIAIAVAALAQGTFDNLSVMREYAVNAGRFPPELWRHMWLAGGSLLAAVIVDALARSRRAQEGRV